MKEKTILMQLWKLLRYGIITLLFISFLNQMRIISYSFCKSFDATIRTAAFAENTKF